MKHYLIGQAISEGYLIGQANIKPITETFNRSSQYSETYLIGQANIVKHI